MRLHLWPPKLGKRGDQRKHRAFTSGHRRQAKGGEQRKQQAFTSVHRRMAKVADQRKHSDFTSGHGQQDEGADPGKQCDFTSGRCRVRGAKAGLLAPWRRSLTGALVAPDTH